MSFSPEADFLILTKGRRYDMLYLMNKMKCIGIALLAMAFLGCKAERAGLKKSSAAEAEKSGEQNRVLSCGKPVRGQRRIPGGGKAVCDGGGGGSVEVV